MIKSLIPEMQGRFSIQKINVKHLINRIKDKKKKPWLFQQMRAKAFEKNPTVFYDKMLNKWEI